MSNYHYKRIVRDSDGDVVPSVTVEVNQAGSETNQAIFSDAAGTAKANPFTSDADGVYEFWVAEGAEIDIDFTKTGFSIDSLDGVTIPWITTSAAEARTLTGTAPIEIDGASGTARDLSADRTISIDKSAFLQPSNNLSDLNSASAARTNIDVPGLSVANTLAEALTVRKDILASRIDTARAGFRATTEKKTAGLIADFTAEALSSADSNVVYGDLRFSIDDPTDGSEDGSCAVRLVRGGTRTDVLNLASDGALTLSLATESLVVEDAGSTGATEQDWIEVTVGGVTGFLRVFATK